jgi:PAS domain S-box-containing protein
VNETSKPRPDRAVGPRPPYAVLATVLAASMALVAGLGLTMTDVRRHLGTARQQDIHLEDLSSRIRFLDEVLSTSAHLYASTGDERWRARYRAHDPLLAQALRELELISPPVYATSGGADVSAANDWLLSIEARAMDLAAAADTAGALAELTGQEYVAQRRMYADALGRITAAMREHIQSSTAALYRGLWMLVALAAGSVAVAGAWCVFVASRTHKRAVALAAGMSETARASEREARKLAMVASRTDNAVVIADNTGRIEWVNDGFTRLTGFKADEVRGAEIAPMFRCPDSDAGVLERLEKSVVEGRAFRDELRCRTKTGRQFWAALDLEPLRDERGALTQMLAMVRDITLRREAAERLAQSNAEILAANRKLEEQARELEGKTAALEKARTEAEAASRAKSDFLANMSHEIRTPLNGVIGALELLERTRLDTRQARFSQMAKTSGRALLSLINDILDYSKLDAGALELESIEFSVQGICADIGDMFAKRVEEKGIALTCEVSPLLPRTLMGDPTRLRQVMLNLVSNAIKFTDKGGVTVRVTPERRVGDRLEVRVTVTDSGIGIPQDRVDRLFKSFSQVDASTTRRYGGTGLGLAICKSIVELMGGEIGVASEEGRGSTFYFVVPLGVGEGVEAGGAAWRLQDIRVLALSGRESERSQLDEMLESWGFRHTVAPSDRAGTAMLRGAIAGGEPYDVLLLGVDEPGDALEMAFRIASDPALARVAVLLIIDPEMEASLDVKRVRAAGAAAWVRRPLSESDLLDAIVGATAMCRRGATPAPAPRAAPLARAGGSYDVRVLVAEDNEVNQVIITELLSEAGYLAVVAENGKRAVEEALSGKYDLVLMDCQMPEMDGLEASREIRRAEAAGTKTCRAGSRVPIVALTANALPADRERCLNAGMDEYLTKPLNADALMAMLQRLTAHSASAFATPGQTHAPRRDSGTDVSPQPSTPAPAGASTGTDASAAILDIEGLRNRCRGKTALMSTVLSKFVAVTGAALSDLEAAVRNGDLAGAARLGHTLKGASANVGAVAVSRAAGGLEASCKAGDQEGAGLGLARVRAAMDELRPAITDALSTLGGGGAAGTDTSAHNGKEQAA